MPSYKVPTKRQKQEVTYDDRMNVIAEEYKQIGYTYVLDRDEKEALIFEKYKQKFKSTYSYSLQNVFRIKRRNEEYIVYRVNEEVIANNNQVHNCERRVGFHSSPITQTTTKDEFGEVKDVKITGYKLIYEIPFDKEFLKDLLAKSKERCGNLAVGRGSESPPEIIASNIQAVFNEQEFIEHDFEDLFGASIGGFLRTEPGRR